MQLSDNPINFKSNYRLFIGDNTDSICIPRNMDDVIKWIALNQKRLRLNQGDLGKALGISQPQVSELMNGRRRVKIEDIASLEELFGESYSEGKTELQSNTAQSAGEGLKPLDVDVAAEAHKELLNVLQNFSVAQVKTSDKNRLFQRIYENLLEKKNQGE